MALRWILKVLKYLCSMCCFTFEHPEIRKYENPENLKCTLKSWSVALRPWNDTQSKDKQDRHARMRGCEEDPARGRRGKWHSEISHDGGNPVVIRGNPLWGEFLVKENPLQREIPCKGEYLIKGNPLEREIPCMWGCSCQATFAHNNTNVNATDSN